MFRARVADHYRARGYRVHEATRVQGDSGTVHAAGLVAEGPLGNLVVEFAPADEALVELASLRTKARDMGASPVLAVPEADATLRQTAARIGVAILDEAALAAPAPEPEEADEPATPWPDRRPSGRPEPTAELWKGARPAPPPRRPERQRFAWLSPPAPPPAPATEEDPRTMQVEALPSTPAAVTGPLDASAQIPVEAREAAPTRTDAPDVRFAPPDAGHGGKAPRDAAPQAPMTAPPATREAPGGPPIAATEALLARLRGESPVGGTTRVVRRADGPRRDHRERARGTDGPLAAPRPGPRSEAQRTPEGRAAPRALAASRSILRSRQHAARRESVLTPRLAAVAATAGAAAGAVFFLLALLLL